jgi:inhibitor of cysteine peptidase
MLVVDERQSGSSIDIPRGEVLAIRLKENAGSGYRWSLESADGLALEESVHVAASAVPGAGGIHEFRFRAAAPGTHQLQLKHWRDWQGEGSVISRYLINVRIG